MRLIWPCSRATTTANENTARYHRACRPPPNVVEEETITQAGKRLRARTCFRAFAALIDGKHATMGSELRTVLTVGAQTALDEHLGEHGLIRGYHNRGVLEEGWYRAIQSRRDRHGNHGWHVRRFRRAGSRPGRRWSRGYLERRNAALIDPVYSSAKTGEIQLTMNSFWNFRAYQASESSFARLKFVA